MTQMWNRVEVQVTNASANDWVNVACKEIPRFGGHFS